MLKQYKPEREIIEKEEKDYRYLEKMRHAHKGQDSTSVHDIAYVRFVMSSYILRLRHVAVYKFICVLL